jgi:pimeloyl-ACP methyl ester carboxylesterase
MRMKSHRIKGGAGVHLHVVETGKPAGRTILFIHGISQCSLTWTRQLNSDLAASFRLVAMDLRGHGLSDKPREGYADSRLWADDVNAVIRTLDLERPVLCGWSYGPLVILDYLRHYGEDAIAGADFVGGVTKLGSEEAAAVLTADFLDIVPGLFSADAEESVRGLDSLLSLCYGAQLSDEDRYEMLGYNVSVPPYIRQALFSRSFDNDDLLPKLRKPVLITHGAADAVVKPTVIEQQMNRIPTARVRLMPGVGHAAFWWDGAKAYNQGLREFTESL